MAWRSIGLWLFAALAWQTGCDDADAPPTVAGGRRTDAGGDVAEPAPADAAMDAAEVRGETPVWPEAEHEIELAYMGPTMTHLLSVDAVPAALDVHLNVDTTSSIRFAIDELQTALRDTVIDRLRARVDDVAFGVSRFADFPILPFGNPGTDGRDPDQPYVLLTPMTTNVDRVIRAVAQLDQPLDHGEDLEEASAEALYQVATGEGFTIGRRRLIEREPGSAAISGSRGGVGFRDRALHVLLHIADSPSHTPKEYTDGEIPGTRSMDEATNALRKLGVRVVSILPTPCESDDCRSAFPYFQTRRELSQLARATGAIAEAVGGDCPTGIDQASLPPFERVCPMVFDARIDGTGLSRTVSDAVLALLEQVRWGEVHSETGDDHLGFVRALQVEAVPQPAGVAAPEVLDLRPSDAPDGVADSFVQVERRNQLGFRVTLRNERIAEADVPQRFRISIRVVGDSVLLGERILRVVVPARRSSAPPTNPDLDAGL